MVKFLVGSALVWCLVCFGVFHAWGDDRLLCCFGCFWSIVVWMTGLATQGQLKLRVMFEKCVRDSKVLVWVCGGQNSRGSSL